MQITQEEKVVVAVTKKEEPPRKKGISTFQRSKYCPCPVLFIKYTGYGCGVL
jgi:hypothetical protein